MIPVDPMNRLLAALATARTPGRKMRVLVRAWRALRRMSPDQRKLLAAEVGSDGAEDLLEQLSNRHSGVKPALLMQALERLRGTDPSELVQLAEEFRRPAGRKRLVDRGLEAAREAMAGAEPPAESSDAGGESARPDSGGKSVPVAAIVAPVAAALPISKPTPAPKPVDTTVPIAVPTPAPIPVATPRPTPPPEPRTPPKPAPIPPARARVPEPRPKAAVPSTPVEDPARLIEAVGRTPSLVRRLALVRGALRALPDWPIDRLGELIEQFPEGWPRRRALSAILDAGIPRDRHRAVYLIEKLDSPLSRRWCVRALLRRPGWSEGERKALIERHDLPRSTGARPAATAAGA